MFFISHRRHCNSIGRIFYGFPKWRSSIIHMILAAHNRPVNLIIHYAIGKSRSRCSPIPQRPTKWIKGVYPTPSRLPHTTLLYPEKKIIKKDLKLTISPVFFLLLLLKRFFLYKYEKISGRWGSQWRRWDNEGWQRLKSLIFGEKKMVWKKMDEQIHIRRWNVLISFGKTQMNGIWSNLVFRVD